MNIARKQKLDIFKVPLIGMQLIEASAGTGKTFTIVLLYLRLLLGIGCIKKFLVQEILVVTFTNAAKEELYLRIRENIKNLYISCINNNYESLISKLFFKEIKNIDEAIILLTKARNNIDQASIYTIHEFCQKTLESNTFSFHTFFQQKIIENEEKLYLQATEDFWRYYFYPLSEDIINIISKEYLEPKHLLKIVKPFLHISSINIQHNFTNNETITNYHNTIIQKIDNFKKKWLLHHNNILLIINQSNINKKIYNQSNLLRWVNIINIWSKNRTKNYYIPMILKYFEKKKIEKHITDKKVLSNSFFQDILNILKDEFSLKNIILFFAIKKIPKFLKKNKTIKSLLSFDDLLTILLKNIKKYSYFIPSINKKYPITFIDEFQDTDIKQYQIFNLIYKKHQNTTLFLIGDPKQAIYSFRGADIFSYLHAKNKIKNYYYLDTNWRSSTNMCRSINTLFSQFPSPFLLKNIPFIPTTPSIYNQNMNFTIKGKIQKELRFFLQPKEKVNIDEYQIWIAKQCAYEISYWLICAKTGDATITIKKGEKILTANDICILVRNKKEAKIIQKELQNMNIISNYSSYQDNIFDTVDAYELLSILHSILDPTNGNIFYKSSKTHIIQKISSINTTIENNYYLIEKFYNYREIWKKNGIYYMIKQIIIEYQSNLNSIEIDTYHQKIINFLHLGELLEKKFQLFFKKSSLLHWFEAKIVKKKYTSYNENTRLLKTLNVIRIQTIHKAKGLEYPIIWIPFSINFHEKKIALYHNEKNFKLFFDIECKNENIKIADKERLSEDLRFLYVALTRSIVHCSIGIAALKKRRSKSIHNHSDIHKSALGYIIQNTNSMDYEQLYNQLKKLSIHQYIEIKKTSIKIKSSLQERINIAPQNLNIDEKKLSNNVWSITSYSKINSENALFIYHQNKKIMKQECPNLNIIKKKKLTTYAFPKGKKTGDLLHHILQNIAFKNTIDYIWLSKKTEEYQIEKKWISILYDWINRILHTPLQKNNIILSELEDTEYMQEFEFFMPIKNILHSFELNKITQLFDPISASSPKIYFNSIRGFIRGCIDLVFIWKKKYYIIDYKSNWLGQHNHDYSDNNIKKEMIKNRYDLQYQIYTLAIHKYLQEKIKKYDYHTHFGGVFYIFLRAIDKNKNNNGIFYTIPDYALIKKMMGLFSGENI